MSSFRPARWYLLRTMQLVWRSTAISSEHQCSVLRPCTRVRWGIVWSHRSPCTPDLAKWRLDGSFLRRSGSLSYQLGVSTVSVPASIITCLTISRSMDYCRVHRQSLIPIFPSLLSLNEYLGDFSMDLM